MHHDSGDVNHQPQAAIKYRGFEAVKHARRSHGGPGACKQLSCPVVLQVFLQKEMVYPEMVVFLGRAISG